MESHKSQNERGLSDEIRKNKFDSSSPNPVLLDEKHLAKNEEEEKQFTSRQLLHAPSNFICQYHLPDI